MNLFEILVNLNHKNRTKSWVETSAVFTGKRNRAANASKVGYKDVDYYEYEIIYNVCGKEQRGWYTFYPLPDPDIEEIKDSSIKIKYNKRKPYIFEVDE